MTEDLTENQKRIIEQEERLGRDLSTGRYSGDFVPQVREANTPNPFLPAQQNSVAKKQRSRVDSGRVVSAK